MNRCEADLPRVLPALRNPGTIAPVRLSRLLRREQAQRAVSVLDGVKSARVCTLAEIIGETEGGGVKNDQNSPRATEGCATVGGNPEADQNNSQKGTPPAYGRQTFRRGRGAKTQVVLLIAMSKAFAYGHLTLMVMSGQRTGRVNRTQKRVGVCS